jgi:hypothetical protein
MSSTLTPTVAAPAVRTHRGAALAVLCASVFIINVAPTPFQPQETP